MQPFNGQFWYWLGNHYTDSGMADKAAEAYSMAERYPSDKGVHYPLKY